MGDVRPLRPVLLLVAIFSRYAELFDWADERLQGEFGPIGRRSDRFPFIHSNYYESTMGTEIQKSFVVFERLVDPAKLPAIKLWTNDVERQAKDHFGQLTEARPLNLDPGYLTEAKLVLATTKDRDHRIYLDRGIFAEVTLIYQSGSWKSRPWTYPDYCQSEYHQFFSTCREYLRTRYRCMQDSDRE